MHTYELRRRVELLDQDTRDPATVYNLTPREGEEIIVEGTICIRGEGLKVRLPAKVIENWNQVWNKKRGGRGEGGGGKRARSLPCKLVPL